MDDPRAIVDRQAKDEALWLLDPTAAEAYLQQALRELHAAVEADPTQAVVDAARALCAEWERWTLPTLRMELTTNKVRLTRALEALDAPTTPGEPLSAPSSKGGAGPAGGE